MGCRGSCCSGSGSAAGLGLGALGECLAWITSKLSSRLHRSMALGLALAGHQPKGHPAAPSPASRQWQWEVAGCQPPGTSTLQCPAAPGRGRGCWAHANSSVAEGPLWAAATTTCPPGQSTSPSALPPPPCLGFPLAWSHSAAPRAQLRSQPGPAALATKGRPRAPQSTLLVLPPQSQQPLLL